MSAADKAFIVRRVPHWGITKAGPKARHHRKAKTRLMIKGSQSILRQSHLMNVRSNHTNNGGGVAGENGSSMESCLIKMQT